MDVLAVLHLYAFVDLFLPIMFDHVFGLWAASLVSINKFCTRNVGSFNLGPVGKHDHAFHGVNHAFGVQSRFLNKNKKNKK